MWFSALSQAGEQSTRTLSVTVLAVSVVGGVSNKVKVGKKLFSTVRTYSVSTSSVIEKIGRNFKFATSVTQVSPKVTGVRSTRKLIVSRTQFSLVPKNCRTLLGKKILSSSTSFSVSPKTCRTLVGKRLNTVKTPLSVNGVNCRVLYGKKIRVNATSTSTSFQLARLLNGKKLRQTPSLVQVQTYNSSRVISRRLSISRYQSSISTLPVRTLFGRLTRFSNSAVAVSFLQSRLLYGRKLNSGTSQYVSSYYSAAFRFTRMLKIGSTSANILLPASRVLRGRFISISKLSNSTSYYLVRVLAKRKLSYTQSLVTSNTYSTKLLASRRYKYSNLPCVTSYPVSRIRATRRIPVSMSVSQVVPVFSNRLLFNRKLGTSATSFIVQRKSFNALRGRVIFSTNAGVSSALSVTGMRATRILRSSNFALTLTHGNIPVSNGFKLSVGLTSITSSTLPPQFSFTRRLSVQASNLLASGVPMRIAKNLKPRPESSQAYLTRMTGKFSPVRFERGYLDSDIKTTPDWFQEQEVQNVPEKLK